MPSVDIIIGAYGGVDLTWRCLLHLWDFGIYDQRIIVVDDGSDDNMPKIGAWLNETGKARYVRHPENRGVYATWNTGLKACEVDSAPAVVIINNDAAIMPFALECLLSAHAQGYKYGCARQVNDASHRMDPSLGLDRVTAPTAITAVNGHDHTCFLLDRQALNQVGHFDERYRIGCGDVDMICRLGEIDVNAIIVNEAVVWHGGSVSRKRLGLEKDLAACMADEELLHKTWAHRPDLLARGYRRRSPEEMRDERVRGWRVGEQ